MSERHPTTGSAPAGLTDPRYGPAPARGDGAAGRRVVAVDVGGTGIKAALLDRGAAVRHREHRATGRERGPAAVVDTIVAVVTELLRHAERQGAEVDAVGLAVPGIVDETTGTGVHSTTIGWRDVPFRELLAERTGLPVAVTHDVRAGGTAEARLGAGRGAERFLFVPVGTSIAAAVMTGGRAEPGAHHRAGEIGHLVVRPGGEACACGALGCAETYVSAAAVARRYAAATGRQAPAEEVARLAAAGDRAARAVWAEAVDALADAVATAALVLDPPLVVLGGGLAESGRLLLDPLAAALADRARILVPPRLVPAALGSAAGCLGAGLRALDAAAGAPSAPGPAPVPAPVSVPAAASGPAPVPAAASGRTAAP
ncbi:ROK family protein [Kitasatospora sp. CM 4170]|uniref:ROK family protein n=1 Tax=Kitasatospora aburaviensis TaxID=67265 RepID=A0ABW1EZ60_9ACTN|nr:ROK family protein [Kitasatospora sp. CM 4170]WNM49719.1 ROK family protein [Kitasatospora sp. CM 4170]